MGSLSPPTPPGIGSHRAGGRGYRAKTPTFFCEGSFAHARIQSPLIKWEYWEVPKRKGIMNTETPTQYDFVVNRKDGTKTVLLFDSHEDLMVHVVNFGATQARFPDISILGYEFGPRLDW